MNKLFFGTNSNLGTFFRWLFAFFDLFLVLAFIFASVDGQWMAALYLFVIIFLPWFLVSFIEGVVWNNQWLTQFRQHPMHDKVSFVAVWKTTRRLHRAGSTGLDFYDVAIIIVKVMEQGLTSSWIPKNFGTEACMTYAELTGQSFSK